MKTKFGIMLTLVGGGVLAAYSSIDYSQFEKPLSKDQEILHVLNRLTFGPRPGDVEAVQQMGVKKWIDQQLHPERITESSEVVERLRPLDSLRMTPAEIAANYPPGGVGGAKTSGLLPLPKDPEARQRVQLQAERFRAKQDAKADPQGKQGKGDPLQQAPFPQPS